jgi:hypothetical protein
MPLSSKATSLIRSLQSKTTSFIRPLPLMATPFIRPDYICTEMFKYYYIVPPPHERPLLLKGYFLLEKGVALYEEEYCIYFCMQT